MDNGNGGEFEGEVPPVAFDGAVEDYESPPKPDSPRTIWFRENREMLDKKEEEEKTAKQVLMDKAKEYIAAFYTVRPRSLEKRHEMRPVYFSIRSAKSVSRRRKK